MLRTPVVPERHRVLPPAEAALEVASLNVTKEEAQDRVSLGPRKTYQACRKQLVDEDRLSTGNRMGPNYRMLGPGVVTATILATE
jgi:hypothetical protein